jgi:hypothetical protein
MKLFQHFFYPKIAQILKWNLFQIKFNLASSVGKDYRFIFFNYLAVEIKNWETIFLYSTMYDLVNNGLTDIIRA